jgi:hypothetical protein
MYMPRGRPRKNPIIEEPKHETDDSTSSVSLPNPIDIPVPQATDIIENIRILGEKKGIYEMSDAELCTATWRGIVREYLLEGKHPTMILKASELLAKTAGCLYGGGGHDVSENTPVFINNTEIESVEGIDIEEDGV